MKKAVLNQQSESQVINRIMAITPDSKGLWGIMTVNEMMFHCAIINGGILKGKENFQKLTLKQKGLQLLVLGLMKGLPKGIKTNPKYVKPKEDQTAFDELKNQLLASVNKVVLHGEENLWQSSHVRSITNKPVETFYVHALRPSPAAVRRLKFHPFVISIFFLFAGIHL